MNPPKQKQSSSRSKAPTPAGSARPFIVWGVVIAGIVMLALMAKRGRQSASNEPNAAPSQAGQGTITNTNPAAGQAQSNFQKLTGKWLRPDGGYVIEIKSVDQTGKLDAGYFNPRPIHVAKAEAKQEGNALKVFIELQDVNYPGSTYTLTYVPERELLVGNYYQALQQQNFDVYFERLK